MPRPSPPEGLTEEGAPKFVPAPEVVEWLRATFIDEGAPLYNPEHEHLGGAELAVLWTNVPNFKQGKQIVGTAEMPSQSSGTRWQSARKRQQIDEWFGFDPDFLITIDAVAAREWSDDRWCAVLEHELLHCGQESDNDGLPRFDRDGNPVFGMRPHDIQEFISIVARYGAVAANVTAMIEAGKATRVASEEAVYQACGTCRGS